MTTKPADNNGNGRRITIATTMFTDNLLIAETIVRAGADAILFDMQHGFIAPNSLPALCQLVKSLDATPMVRVPSAESSLVASALDAGALHIICPTVESSEQATAFVSACHFPPLGRRSFGPARPFAYGNPAHYVHDAGAMVKPIVMIESVAGMAHVEAIAETPGIAGLLIGPADLAGTHGHRFALEQDSREIQQMHEHIVAAARMHNVMVGTFVASPQHAQQQAYLEFDFVMAGADLMNIGASIESTTRDVAHAFGKTHQDPKPSRSY